MRIDAALEEHRERAHVVRDAVIPDEALASNGTNIRGLACVAEIRS